MRHNLQRNTRRHAPRIGAGLLECAETQRQRRHVFARILRGKLLHASVSPLARAIAERWAGGGGGFSPAGAGLLRLQSPCSGGERWYRLNDSAALCSKPTEFRSEEAL